MAFNSGNKRSPKLDIEVSTDEVTWEKVYSGESSAKTINLEPFDFDDVDAQYIKIVGHGNRVSEWNSYSEVQIYAPNVKGTIINELDTTPPGPDSNAKPYTVTGLYNVNSTEHVIDSANKVIGSTIDVTRYGSNSKDNSKDDTVAIQAAIDAAILQYFGIFLL